MRAPPASQTAELLCTQGCELTVTLDLSSLLVGPLTGVTFQNQTQRMASSSFGIWLWGPRKFKFMGKPQEAKEPIAT